MKNELGVETEAIVVAKLTKTHHLVSHVIPKSQEAKQGLSGLTSSFILLSTERKVVGNGHGFGDGETRVLRTILTPIRR
jgi:hypothetical protein